MVSDEHRGCNFDTFFSLRGVYQEIISENHIRNRGVYQETISENHIRNRGVYQETISENSYQKKFYFRGVYQETISGNHIRKPYQKSERKLCAVQQELKEDNSVSPFYVTFFVLNISFSCFQYLSSFGTLHHTGPGHL